MEEFYQFSLSNNIRIIHKPTQDRVAHCGFIIDTGSRDEKINENGIAHFIEHTFFKGTAKRRASNILNRIDSVGGELNAYTTKEKTCIYASFLTEHFERATELLSDILFNSTFPEVEIEKEKEVIIDEIHSYEDSPYDQIFDEFEELVYKNHPLGQNILGTEKSVKNLSRNAILQFIERNYSSSEIVFSVVGNISSKKLYNISTKYLSNCNFQSSIKTRKKVTGYLPFNTTLKKDFSQSHSIIGNLAYGTSDKKKPTFILLNNILGGPAMNSRLNMTIREKYGFAYSIESSYNSYIDTGLFSIYVGTDEKNSQKSIELILKELAKFRNQQLSTIQLHRAKQQLIGQIILSDENNVNVMLGVGKSLLTHGKVDSLEDVYQKINTISATDILNAANEVFDKKQLSILTYHPI